MTAELRIFDADEGQTPPPALLSFAPIADPDLSWRACGILWALCHWAWGRKSDCWPSNGQVARLAKCSPRTVQLGLAELERAGYIARRMEKTATGWHRMIRLTERAPAVRIAEVGAVAPPARTCATPVKDLAPPPAQDPTHQRSKSLKEKEEESAGRPTGQGRRPADPAEARGEPEWHSVESAERMTAADLAHWRDVATVAGPFGRIARRILENWERHDARRKAGPAPGSPAKEPRGPAEDESATGVVNPTKSRASGQDNLEPAKHKKDS